MLTVAVLFKHWRVSLALLVLTAIAAWGVDSSVAPKYGAPGTVRIAPADVNPARSALEAVDIESLLSSNSTPDAREEVRSAGGTADYRTVFVSRNRAQVLASGDEATRTVNLVLQRLADGVQSQQIAAGIDEGDRVDSRLSVEVPEADDDSLAAPEDQNEVVGSLTLAEPLAVDENRLEGVAVASRLLRITLASDERETELQDLLGPSTSFRFAVNGRGSDGLIHVTTTGDDAEEALAAFHTVVDEMAAELDNRQARAAVPRSQRLVIEILAEPLSARDLSSTIALRTLLVSLLGIAATIAIALWLEIRNDHDARPDADDIPAMPPPDTPRDSEPDVRVSESAFAAHLQPPRA